MVERKIVLDNNIGLHARPASKFTRIASKFNSDIILIRDGRNGNGKSLLSILALGIFEDTEFLLRIIGDDELDAISAIIDLVERKFID